MMPPGPMDMPPEMPMEEPMGPPSPMGAFGAMAQRMAPGQEMYYNPVTDAEPNFDQAMLGPDVNGDPVRPMGGMGMDMGLGMGQDLGGGMMSGEGPMGGLPMGPPSLPHEDPSANPMARRQNRDDAIGMLSAKAKARQQASMQFQDMARRK